MVSAEGVKYLERMRRERTPFGIDGFDLEGLRKNMSVRREPPAELGVRCLPANIGDLEGEWVIAPGADEDFRLLYMHGGGYVSGCPGFYLAMAARISAAAKCAVFMPDYRLAPEHPFPAGLEDCIRAYLWLRDNGPGGAKRAKSVFISGDSAGGGLTLAMVLALRDRGLPMPPGAIPISPYADLTLTGDSIRSQRDLDPIMHPNCLGDFVRLYVGDQDVRHPYISPIFGDYTGVCPLLIQVGEHEVIRDDSVNTEIAARRAGVDVKLEIYPGMFHVFQSHEPLLPEAVTAFGRIADFMRSLA
ncbi:MAG: alpha/beta hydrolase [Phycisphaerales bacterium]|jgi:acetyl esterase/lipase|nr:alpha/beta hydrolase [Phycisphaerales bacterium]